jgi:hypothetical protein
VALVVIIDELLNPIEVTIFGARAEMAATAYDRNLVQQARGCGKTP